MILPDYATEYEAGMLVMFGWAYRKNNPQISGEGIVLGNIWHPDNKGYYNYLVKLTKDMKETCSPTMKHASYYNAKAGDVLELHHKKIKLVISRYTEDPYFARKLSPDL